MLSGITDVEVFVFWVRMVELQHDWVGFTAVHAVVGR